MTKNENNDSFMRDKNIMRAVDGKRKSHFAWPYKGWLPFFREIGPSDSKIHMLMSEVVNKPIVEGFVKKTSTS